MKILFTKQTLHKKKQCHCTIYLRTFTLKNQLKFPYCSFVTILNYANKETAKKHVGRSVNLDAFRNDFVKIIKIIIGDLIVE